jgi:hypothetical protein
MAEFSATSFLDLSTELRLEVYKHVIVNQLHNGHSSGLVGLFMSCHTIQQELEKEYIVNARALLNAQQAWKRTCQETAKLDFEPIRMRILPDDLLCRATNRTLSIIFPISAIWNHLDRTAKSRRVLMYQLVHSALFTPLYAGLRPVFQLPWSILQLDVRNTSKVGHKNWNFASEVEKGFFESRSNIEEDRSAMFKKTDRLVLNYGHEAVDSRGNVLDSMIEAFKRDISYGAVPRIMTKPERMWVARVQDGEESERGWKVIYDSRDDLPDVEDAVLEVVFEDDMWKAKFLPDRWIWDEFEESELQNWDFDQLGNTG